MELRDLNSEYRLAFVGIVETIKDEFSYLDEDSDLVFEDIFNQLGKDSYNGLIKEFEEKFKNTDEFKYFLLSLDNYDAIELIHEYALGLTPMDLDVQYTIVDFLEENFSFIFGEPDPELTKEQKIVFLAWLEYLNLLPEGVYDESNNDYALNLWIDIEEDEFKALYSKLVKKEILGDDDYDKELMKISSEILDQDVRNYIFDTIVMYTDLDLEEDIEDYPMIKWLVDNWTIELEEL